MTLLWTCIWILAVAALLHTYLFYPWLLQLLSRNKHLPVPDSTKPYFPRVSVLLAVYNEEKVIRAKLESIFKSNYPADRLELVVGSDNSTDATNAIIQEWIDRGYAITFVNMPGRTGKTGIMNHIKPLAKGDILIPTDANILFEVGMIQQLVYRLQDPQTALVSARVVNTGMRKEGISYQERAYIDRENRLKYQEGVIWGTMMGAFGACYAIKKEAFPVIPDNFFMEDFYVTLSVIQQNQKALCDLEALAFEDVSDQWQEEFKRKIRISIGNYQNLGVFYGMLWPFWKPAGFSFLSHKVLRWLGPFLLLAALISSFFLQMETLYWKPVFYIQLLGILSPGIDFLLRRLNIHTFAGRLMAYFYLMNAALLVGFWKYLKGVKSSAWSPTARNI